MNNLCPFLVHLWLGKVCCFQQCASAICLSIGKDPALIIWEFAPIINRALWFAEWAVRVILFHLKSEVLSKWRTWSRIRKMLVPSAVQKHEHLPSAGSFLPREIYCNKQTWGIFEQHSEIFPTSLIFSCQSCFSMVGTAGWVGGFPLNKWNNSAHIPSHWELLTGAVLLSNHLQMSWVWKTMRQHNLSEI